MTKMPAERLGLKDRGRLTVGARADIVLLDPAVIIDNATFSDPLRLSGGIRTVLVNGVKVWDGQKVTGNLPGEILRKGGGN
jgi:N-acyl-D-aspartate/D-glutamate deacylase